MKALWLLLTYVSIVRTEICSTETLSVKKYTVILSEPYINVTIKFICYLTNEKCSLYGNKTTDTFLNRNSTVQPPFYTSIWDYDRKFKSIYNSDAKLFLLEDKLLLPTGIFCEYSQKACFDTKLDAFAYWDYEEICNKTIFQTIYSGDVEHWSPLENPSIKLIQVNINNKTVMFNLLNQKFLCNRNVWRTQQDNILIFDDVIDPPVLNETLVSHLNNSNNNFGENYFFNHPKLVNYLLSVFILFIIIKFVGGAVVNCFVLASTGKLSCCGILMRCFSQSLTNQHLLSVTKASIRDYTYPEVNYNNKLFY